MKRQLTLLASIISILALALVIYAVASSRSEPLQSFSAGTATNSDNVIFGEWQVTISHASEAQVGDRITIAKDRITVAGQGFKVLDWDEDRTGEVARHTARISDGTWIITLVGPPHRVSMGLQTGIVSVARVP